MSSRCFISLMVLGLLMIAPTSVLAQQYSLDATHSAVTFQISHMGLSYTHGRFNNVSGQFVISSSNPAASSFAITIATNSVDTGNKQRDDHLRAPDFFNAKQFPTIEFRSTGLTPVKGGLDVTGNLTLHGQTREITFRLEGGKTAEFPAGVHRIGYSSSLQIRRSEFGMTGMPQAVGDDVFIVISFEGIRQ